MKKIFLLIVLSAPFYTFAQAQKSGNQDKTDNGSLPGGKCTNETAMAQGDFIVAKSTIEESSMEESKLSTAKNMATANCLNSDQVTEICSLFTFEESKLKFAKFAYKYTTDPKNYFKVNNVFSFDTSKEALNKYISEN
jgi:hypothetical protein